MAADPGGGQLKSGPPDEHEPRPDAAVERSRAGTFPSVSHRAGRFTGSWGRNLAFALGALWTLPNTLFGLLLGMAGMPFGARARMHPGALAVVFQSWPWGPGGAITFGNVILHTGPRLDVACVTYVHAAGLVSEPAVCLADHERAHVLQYLVLGPTFLPVYLACGGIGVRNRFERAADRYAATGAGWWPWPAPALPARSSNSDRR